MKSDLRTRLLLGAPGVALALVAAGIAQGGPDSGRLLNTLLAGTTVLILWGVAVAVRLRYPDRSLGPILFALAVLMAMHTLIASRDPLLFTLARAGRPAAEVLLIWVMLAFPSGRLESARERTILAAAVLAVAFLWVPSVLLSAGVPGVALLGKCRPDCPANVFLVADAPDAAHAFHIAFRAAGAAILVATAATLFVRLRGAAPLMRRVLAPVLVASIARALTVVAYLAAGSFTTALQVASAVTLWLVPLAIGLGLLRGRLYVARALQQLVAGMRGRPGMHELRDVMARALGDPTLEVAYWLKDGERWVDADGRVVALSYPSPARGRAVTLVRDDVGLPVAALVHDEALLDEPTLVEAVASTTLVALESHRLEAELQGTRASAASAVEEERHRIERDLHDGAQQRLIAIRMKLGVTARLLENDPARVASLVGELGRDVDTAIRELRDFAHGVAPSLLVERGLAAALAEAALHTAIPVRTQFDVVGRLGSAVESAVYFCCLEAMQNAAKHAGPKARVELTLSRRADRLDFSVSDDGGAVRAEAAREAAGQGIANMRERMRRVGGRIAAERLAEGGFRVLGEVPLPAGSASAMG